MNQPPISRWSPLASLALLLLVCALVTGARATPADSSSAAHAPGVPGGGLVNCWARAPSPNPSTTSNQLLGVAAVPGNAAWAVGFSDDNGTARTLALYWDGTTWRVVPSPNASAGGSTLAGVAVVSSQDAWAVGSGGPLLQGQTLVEHWDGTGWTIVPSPSPGTQFSTLTAVSAHAANDVWAVGYAGDPNLIGTLVEHWDGTQWTIVPAPALPGTTDNQLFGVAAVAATDVWAVGHTGVLGRYDTLILHWNGSQWAPVATPASGARYNELRGITALAANDIWAVGSYSDPGVAETVTLHWDGTSWQRIANPSPGPYALFYAVAAVANNDIWAVGEQSVNNLEQPLTEHWDGAAWTIVASPGIPSINNYIRAVAADGPSDVWLAGYTQQPFGTQQTLTVHYAPCATATATPSPQPTLPPGCAPGWVVVPGPGGGVLQSVAVVHAADVWAVGTNNFQTLTAHWNGASWSAIPSPNPPGAVSSILQSVTAIAANDVWAVGHYFGPTGGDHHLLEHWDGLQWTVVAGPTLPTPSDLFGVSAVAANDVWAVGITEVNGASSTLTLHWDGSAWTVVPSPNSGTASGFQAVTARAANDVWAAGTRTVNFRISPLVEHWDGTQWTIAPCCPTPPTTGYAVVSSIVATAANDAWVGGYYLDMNNAPRPLLDHWDGGAWTVVPAPIQGTGDNELYGLAAITANDIWAVGYYNSSPPPLAQTLTEHWDGTSWSIIPSPSGGSNPTVFNGVAAVNTNDLWAVGLLNAQTLVAHYTPICTTPSPTVTGTPPTATPTRPASLTPTHTPTYTPTGTPTVPSTATFTFTPTRPPATATYTPTAPASPTRTQPPAATPTLTPPAPPPPSQTPAPPTPTHCAITFSDVDLNNPFYVFIRCLACRDIVSGYADGMFRWQNNVTRGQLAKIIANAAGLAAGVPSTQQTFADVPAGNPFWVYIERLAGNGAISGYACGGPGEPCDPARRPYFRPTANATRGQIAKIDAVAAQLADPVPTTQQTFADVPLVNPFWLWIEQLAGRGVISGYACGGANEPCDPQGRPYFRWGLDTTRGQMAKIAAQTFFPNCQTPARR